MAESGPITRILEDESGKTLSDGDRKLIKTLLSDTESLTDDQRRLRSRQLDKVLSGANARKLSDGDRRIMKSVLKRSEGGTAEAPYKTRAAAEKAAEREAGTVIKVEGGFAVVPANQPDIGEYFEKPPEKRGMGGVMVDELGYTRGIMPQEEKRGAVKYSVGGAIKGKNFAGIF